MVKTEKRNLSLLNWNYLLYLSFERGLSNGVVIFTTLDNRPFLPWPTFVDLNPDKLRYNPFITSLVRCNTTISCNAAVDSSDRLCDHSKTKDINLKNMKNKYFMQLQM